MTTHAGAAEAVWAYEEHEHRDLVRGINRIHDVACAIGREPTPELSLHVLEILAWLQGTLDPHIGWEETWLYREIDARTGTPWATRSARFDHRQIHDMADKLRRDHGSLGNRDNVDHHAELRCHLFGLEALIRAHIEREERFLIPLLNDDRPIYAPPAG